LSLVRLFLTAAFLGGCLWAHDPKLTFARVRIDTNLITVELTTPAASLSQLFGPEILEWKNPELPKKFSSKILEHLVFSNETAACTSKLKSAVWLESIGSVRYTFLFTSEKPLNKIDVKYDLYLDLPDTYANFNSVEFDLLGYQAQFVFRAERRHISLSVKELLEKWKREATPSKK
jgi:hypothetical protein